MCVVEGDAFPCHALKVGSKDLAAIHAGFILVVSSTRKTIMFGRFAAGSFAAKASNRTIPQRAHRILACIMRLASCLDFTDGTGAVGIPFPFNAQCV